MRTAKTLRQTSQENTKMETSSFVLQVASQEVHEIVQRRQTHSRSNGERYSERGGETYD